MVLRRSLLPLIIVTAALFAAAPASASFEVSVEVEANTGEIPVGGSLDHTVSVTASSAELMVCPSGGTLTVDLRVEDEAPDVGFTGDVSPASVSFGVPSGVYGGALDPWQSEDPETSTFTSQATDQVQRGHLDHTYTVFAAYDGSAVGDCTTAEEEPAPSEDSATVGVTAQAPEEDEENGENGDNGDNGDGGGGDTEEGPGPAIGVLILVAAAIVSLRRRQ